MKHVGSCCILDWYLGKKTHLNNLNRWQLEDGEHSIGPKLGPLQPGLKRLQSPRSQWRRTGDKVPERCSSHFLDLVRTPKRPLDFADWIYIAAYYYIIIITIIITIIIINNNNIIYIYMCIIYILYTHIYICHVCIFSSQPETSDSRKMPTTWHIPGQAELSWVGSRFGCFGQWRLDA